MTLYHGTSASQGVLNELPKGVHLTDNFQVAKSYAAEDAARLGGNMIVYKVTIPDSVCLDGPYALDVMGHYFWISNKELPCYLF